ncbi:hypothetical protein EJB05_43068 [Eragrostis curvula]|uniref:AP2/ERF domain-containing protein n=1 Tax=Eragrostis curvula TaxID=38414 RepID=A0A5J9TE43_9POAL|nr:hypothetical protein EJB05_43068 [Eragrostis curvula]
MAKPRKNSTAAAAAANSNSAAAGNVGVRVKPKRTRKSVPRESPSQRSSVYRGVTRHRWTGRFEAHLWDKNSWNESQNKKGKQGAYDDEDAAARAYDLAALKYWGPDTILNFPASAYEEELKEMEGQSREEYIGSLRRPMKFIHRKSSGFSRGVSKYRGVARHHHNGRWEARIGRSAEAHFPVPPRTSLGHTPTTSALSLLLQSPKFKEMIARTTAAESSTTSSSPPPTPSPPRPSPSQELQVQAAKDGGVASPQSFPDDIQTFFGCEDVAGVGVGVGYTDVDGLFFGDLAAYASPAFHFELDL